MDETQTQEQLLKAIQLLASIFLSKRAHYNNEWHLTIDNNTMYRFDCGCKELGVKKPKGPALTEKTSREEKLRKRMEKKKKMAG